jgi:hypothetical protein
MVTEDSDENIQVAGTWRDDTVGLPVSDQRRQLEEQTALVRSRRERVEGQDAEQIVELVGE